MQEGAGRGGAWKGVTGRGRGVAERVGPGRPPRNSFAGLVRQNCCVRSVRSGQHAWQRFCQRCLSQSDSRGNLPGPTRPATVLRYTCGRALFYLRGASILHSFGITMPHPHDIILRHPREGGDPGFVGQGRSFSSAWIVAGRAGPGRPASKLLRWPRKAESLRAGR